MLTLTTEEQTLLATIRAAARVRHEKARRAAKARGRIHFPDLPIECSWAFEEAFRVGMRATLPHTPNGKAVRSGRVQLNPGMRPLQAA